MHPLSFFSLVALLPAALNAWITIGVVGGIRSLTIAPNTPQAYCGCRTRPFLASFRRKGAAAPIITSTKATYSIASTSTNRVTKADVISTSNLPGTGVVIGYPLGTTIPKYYGTIWTYTTSYYCLDTNPDGLTVTGSLKPFYLCTLTVVLNGGLDVITGNYREACNCGGYHKNGFMIGSTNASYFKPACGSIYDWTQFGKNMTLYIDPNAK